MLSTVLGLLRCPHCSGALVRDNATVRCKAGHSFDIARQGYLSLLPGDAELGSADTAAMVSARSAFLGAGHFDPLGAALERECGHAVAVDASGCVVDLGAGTGWYLARLLELLPDRAGLALDLSKHALRRAARAHPRIAAVACDAWRPLPLRDGMAALALSVFAPRNGPELARVLRPDGALIVAAPTRAHLGELVPALGLLSVDERKPERLAAQLDPYFDRLAEHGLDWTMVLDHAGVRDLVGMGPSAPHTEDEALEKAIAALAEPVHVTGSVNLSVYRGRD